MDLACLEILDIFTTRMGTRGHVEPQRVHQETPSFCWMGIWYYLWQQGEEGFLKSNGP